MGDALSCSINTANAIDRTTGDGMMQKNCYIGKNKLFYENDKLKT